MLCSQSRCWSTAVSTLVLVAATATATTTTTGPLDSHFELIAKAARSSLDIYRYHSNTDEDAQRTRTTDGSFTWFRVALTKSGAEQSAVLFEETATDCFATFRGGGGAGLEWIADIDVRKSFVGSFQKPKKRCRVLREYKKLYKQKRTGTRYYRSELEDLLAGCIAMGKEVVFAGHGVGGAMAVIAALANHIEAPLDGTNSTSTIWTVTFGQPPVLMEAKYKAPQVWNQPARIPRDDEKKFCPLLDHSHYVPFVNTEEPDGANGLHYDFVSYLHILLYGIMLARVYDAEAYLLGDADHEFLDCIQDAVHHVETVLTSDNLRAGNLGVQTGGFYLLGEWNESTSYQVGGEEAHGVVEVQMLLDETLIVPSSSTGAASPYCSSAAVFEFGNASVHTMEAYFYKVLGFAFEDGFAENANCNFDSECESGLCDGVLGCVIDGGGGGRCADTGESCLIKKACCEEKDQCFFGVCQGCAQTRMPCEAPSNCCQSASAKTVCKGMKMKNCKAMLR